MHARIFSRVVFKLTTLAFAVITTTSLCPTASGQGGAGFYTDPDTGIVYQKVIQTVERPVVETRISQREQTVYRPQMITETTPQKRIVYSPVVEYVWEPRVHGRWNIFKRPTVKYHHVARTQWETREEVIERTNTRTEWVAEKRTIEVPQQVVRMEREERTNFKVVSRPMPTLQSNPDVSAAIASRLRPIDSNPSIVPMNGSTRIASRNKIQGGLQPTNLAPSAPPLMPSTSTTGSVIASGPTAPIFR